MWTGGEGGSNRGWGKLHDTELYISYFPSKIISDQGWYELGWICSMHESNSNAYTILVEGLKRKRALTTPTRGWKSDTKLILKNWVWGCGLDSSGSGQGSVAVSCEYGNDWPPETLSACGLDTNRLHSLRQYIFDSDSKSGYIQRSNEWMIVEYWIGVGMEGRGRGLTDMLSRYLIRGTKRNHEKLRTADDPECKK
jgi:hypothetical protein